MFGISKKYLPGLSLFVVIFFAPLSARAAEPFQIDAGHSRLGFAVSHLMVSTVRGEFGDFSGTIQFDKSDLVNSSVDVTIKTASIDTRNPQRDEHLRMSDFFDAEKNPMITFKSTKITGEGSNFVITGQLTMRGVTKEISIPLIIAGPVPSPFGMEVIGLSGSAKINRQEFGVSWNKQLDAGGVLVGDEVEIEINVEASRKPQEVPAAVPSDVPATK